MPGIRVVPGRSMVRAPAGAARFGPTAAILSPSTSTDQPSCGVGLTPSNTRAGRRRRVSASTGAAAQRPSNKAAIARKFTNFVAQRARAREARSLAPEVVAEKGFVILHVDHKMR